MDVLSYALSKKFTEDTAIGLGAVKGAPCTIKSITEVDGGQKVTFEWTGNSGTKQTSEMTVKNGVSVTGISDKGNGVFTLLLSDGSESDEIQTLKGEKGLKGEPGVSPTITENADNTDKIYKLDIETVDGKFTTPNLKGADGQGGTGGSGTAEDTTYTNENFPQYDNVDLALDALFNKVYYVKPKINSFTMTPSTTEYEIGTVINEVTFDWTVNKDIVNQTLTDCTITVDDRTATYSSDISSTKTFTLTIYDEENSASSSKKISFLPKIYYGSATEPAEYDSAFALGLSNSVLSSSVKRDYSFNCGSGEYSYIICPTSCSFDGNIWVNGFQADMQGQDSISLTNASGYTQSYDVWRFANHSLGSFVGTVK